MLPPADLAAEAKSTEEAMMAVRREVWRGAEIASRDLLDAAMRSCDLLCKLASRAEKERNRDVIIWLQQTRRSVRALLREYWTDVLDQRRALYAPEAGAATIPVR